MRELLNYLFRPSRISRDAVKSAYSASLKPTHLMMTLGILVSLVFLFVSFIIPDMFGATLYHHRACYTALFLIGLMWSIAAYAAAKDFDSRYKVIRFMNAFTELLLFALVIVLAYFNITILGRTDATLYMMVSMLVPLCIYTNPLEFLGISLVSNLTMLVFQYQAYIVGITTDQAGVVNLSIFSVFQLAMGVTILYT